MVGTNLSNTILIQANLNDTNISGSTIDGARLTISGHSGWTAQNLTGMPVSLPSDLKLQAGALVPRGSGEPSGIVLAPGSAYVMGYHLVPGANLQGANLQFANLSQLDLHGINFTGAHLAWVLFNGSDLSGANLSGSSTSNITMDGANLSGANLSYSWCGGGSTFIEANLTASNLTSLSCDGGNFTGANFTNATMTSAFLSNTQFVNTVLTGATITDTTFGAVRWSNVTSSGLVGTPRTLPPGIVLRNGALVSGP